MIRKFTQGNALTVARLNELVDALNKINNFTGDGLIKVTRSSSGYTFNLNMDGVNARIIKNQGGGGGSSGSANVRNAKIITVNSGSFTVKLLDINGDVEGNNITVTPKILNSANLTSNSWPRLVANDIIGVYQDFTDNDWKTPTVFDKIINVDNFI